MNQPVYKIGIHTIGFSAESIRKNYTKKDDFVEDITNGNPNMDKAKLKKVLDKVWNETMSTAGFEESESETK